MNDLAEVLILNEIASIPKLLQNSFFLSHFLSKVRCKKRRFGRMKHRKYRAVVLVLSRSSQIELGRTDIRHYYSTNSRYAYIWSERNFYATSIHKRYLAIHVGCQDSSEILQSAAQPQFFSLPKAFG